MATILSSAIGDVTELTLKAGDRFEWNSKLTQRLVLNIPRVTSNAVTIKGAAAGTISPRVHSWGNDGFRVTADKGTGVCVIEDGYVIFHGRVSTEHQDGIQGVGGSNVTWKRMVFAALPDPGEKGPTQGWFFQAAGGTPKNLVVEDSVLGPGFNNSVNLGPGEGCGARNCLISKPLTGGAFTNDGHTNAVNEGNEIVDGSDIRVQACIAVFSVEPWLGGASPPPPPPPDTTDYPAVIAALEAERNDLMGRISLAQRALTGDLHP